MGKLQLRNAGAECQLPRLHLDHRGQIAQKTNCLGETERRNLPPCRLKFVLKCPHHLCTLAG